MHLEQSLQEGDAVYPCLRIDWNELNFNLHCDAHWATYRHHKTQWGPMCIQAAMAKQFINGTIEKLCELQRARGIRQGFPVPVW